MKQLILGRVDIVFGERDMRRSASIPIIALVCILLFTIISSGQSLETPLANDSTTVAGENTFMIGTIINPVDQNGTVSARVISLFYYENGLLVESMGFVRGLAQIRFQPNSFFFFTYSPGPFGLVKYVIGLCTDFEVIS